jgi:hypothetical protein
MKPFELWFFIFSTNFKNPKQSPTHFPTTGHFYSKNGQNFKQLVNAPFFGFYQISPLFDQLCEKLTEIGFPPISLVTIISNIALFYS